jgi:Flp pilus assembly protein TadG
MSQFMRDRSGGVALMFAMMATLLIAISGGAMDYARKRSAETLIRNKIDAALFAVAKAKASNESLDVKQAFKTYFDATATDVSNVLIKDVDVTADTDGGVQARVQAAVPASLLNVIGIGSMQIDMTAGAAYNVGALELVLALDSTTSMDDGVKFPGLKAAANELVDYLHDNSDGAGELKIGIVPFAQYVNVGLGNRYASWLDVPPDTTTTEYKCSLQKELLSKSNCVTTTNTCYNDGMPYSCSSESCDYQYGPEKEVCSDVTTTTTWYGCVGSRDYPLNTQDGGFGTPVPGLPNVGCPSQVLPLTKEKDAVKATLNGMTTSGETYIPSGLTWAWRLLSSKAPFGEGAPKKEKIEKYIVLMTDGANTRAPNYPEHNSGDTTLAKTLMGEICTNIKKEGIKIITIAFDVADTETKDALKSCSTAGVPGYSRQSGAVETDAVKTTVPAD